MEDDQQFCLRWNNHQSTLIQNFDTLLESGTLVDCTLAAEGKYLKAHKVVLSACSPYFEGLLSEHYDKHPVFILKDVKFKELKAMMDYMYRGEVNISQDQLAALLKAAESLQIKGLSESKTGGNSGGKTDSSSRQQKVVTQPTAPSLDIPHASSGLTIEKNNKVPRQSMAQSSVGDLPEDSASPQLPKGLSSREGSQSPTSRKRKRFRRRSVGDDNSIENHDASNSSDMPQQMSVPSLGIAPVADEKTHADQTDPLGRSALMQQLTKPAEDMLQLPLEKPEPTESLIEPKSEYLEDNEESVEDLTLDDDMNDLNEMEQDNNRAGPSHDPSQHPGLAAWHVTGDRSNAGGVVGSVAGAPGATDEVFLAAQEAAQAHRDSQDILSVKKSIEIIQQTIMDLEQHDNPIPSEIMYDDYLPVVQPMSNQVTSKDTTDIGTMITRSYGSRNMHLTNISLQLEELKLMISEREANISSQAVSGISSPVYDIKLPLQFLDDFIVFDQRMCVDKDFCNDIMTRMWTIMNISAPLQQILRDICKEFLSREIIIQFTAVKKTGKKLVFSKTKFYSCIQDVIGRKLQRKNKAHVFSNKDFEQAAGRVINNAKDWEGKRGLRKKPID